MKANKKFIEEQEAVSAVIGVILMVAITVAIAATVFVYVNAMAIDDEPTPNPEFKKSEAKDTLTVVSAGGVAVDWTNIKILYDNGGDGDILFEGTYTLAQKDINPWPWGEVHAGQKISFNALPVNIKMVWTPSETLLGQWTFN